MSVVPITLATSNAAKREQLRWLLEGLPLEAVEKPIPEVEESAGDMAGNAALKAIAAASSGLAIASDGGLEIPALGGVWEPIRTRRQGRERLRELAARLTDRRIRWAEAVAIAQDGHLLAVWTECGTEGELAAEPWPAVAGDFWVWDVFFFPALGKVWSALSPVEREQADLTWVALRARVRAFFDARPAG